MISHPSPTPALLAFLNRKSVLWALLCFLTCLPVTLAQAPIDSSRFAWMQALTPIEPVGYYSRALDLGDGNLLAWWNPLFDLVPPNYNDPCAAVISPEGQVLIPGQVAQEHPADYAEAFPGQGCWYQLEEIWRGNWRFAFSLHRIEPDYVNQTFRVSASYTITTVEDSLDNYGYTELAVNDSVVVLAFDQSDVRQPVEERYGNRYLVFTADSLHLVSDSFVVNDTQDYLIGPVEGGFFMRSGLESMFIENNGHIRWRRENEIQGPLRSIQVGNGYCYFATREMGDNVILVVRQDPNTGEDSRSQVLATGQYGNHPMAVHISDGMVFASYGGYDNLDQPMQIHVYNMDLDTLLGSTTIDVQWDDIDMPGSGLIVKSSMYPQALQYRFENGAVTHSVPAACPGTRQANSIDAPFITIGDAALGFHLHFNGQMTVPLAYCLAEWEPVSVAPDRERRIELTAAPRINAYPNPFNGESRLRIELPREDHLTLSVYNLLGQRVILQELGHLPAGEHEVVLPIESLASGQYVARLTCRTMPPVAQPLTHLK